MPISPVLYHPALETISDDERGTIDELIETLTQISAITFADSGHAWRSVHAKAHGLVEAELEVITDLPARLAQGLFSKPGRYPVVMRFSTIPGDVLDDNITVPRAVAFKVIGVSGERLLGSEADVTQDFLMADGPAFAAPNPKKFLANLKLLAKTTDRVPKLKRVLSSVLRGAEGALEKVGGESALLKTLGGHANTHILGATFYGQVPIRFGDYIAKMSLAPTSPELVALRNLELESAGRPDALRDAVRAFFVTTNATWELRAQLCTDLDKMPVEDASVVWPEEESPYVAVARITAKAQDTWSEDRVKRIDDGMSFSPWHGLAAHQPLGSVMRARKETYRHSARFRGERNGCPMHEPAAIAG